MTNVISNSFVIIDASTNGGAVTSMVQVAPIAGLVVVVIAVLAVLALSILWLKKSN